MGGFFGWIYYATPIELFAYATGSADARLRAVDIELTGSYGTDLRELASHIRSTTLDVIAELLGDTLAGQHPVDVTVTDVVTGDPLGA